MQFTPLFNGQKEFEDFIFMAFRYALPRNTYVPDQVSMYIHEHIHTFTDEFLRQMDGEILQHLRPRMEITQLHGSILNYNTWSHLRTVIREELDGRSELDRNASRSEVH